MAEGRMLKKKVSTSKKLMELKTDSARLLWTWLLPHLDVEGKFSADPDIVKGSVVPRLKHFTSAKVEEYLLDMAENGLIVIYEVNGDRYLKFNKFEENQTLRTDREAKSSIPDPVDNVITPEVPPDSSVVTPGVPTDNAVVTPPQDKISKDKIKLSEVKEAMPETTVSVAAQTKNSKLKETEIPEHLKEIWPAYLEMRQKKKKPATEYAKKLVIDQLEKWYPNDPERQIECLNVSIRNSWTDVYKLKENKVGSKYAGLGRDL